MSDRYEISVELPLQPGFTLWMQAIGLHLAAAAAAMTLPVEYFWPAMAIVLISVLRLAWRWWHPQWQSLRWGGWGSLQLERQDGSIIFGSLARRHFLSRRLVIFTIRIREQTVFIPVFRRDHPEAHRRLHQRLTAGRWRSQLNEPQGGDDV